MDKLLELKNITKVYGSKVKTKALKGINLSVDEGEFLSIIGQSGSGKSTLLNIIGALDRPTDGEPYFRGANISRFDDDKLAKFRNDNLGFVFQFHHLLPELNVLENVLMPAWISYGKMPGSKVIDRAKELVSLVNVENRIQNKPNELSGGQRQRIEIARALVNNPSILILDEATSALDPNTERIVYENIRRRGCTCIIVAHRLSTIRDSNEIIVMDQGKIVQRGTHDRLKQTEGYYARLISAG